MMVQFLGKSDYVWQLLRRHLDKGDQQHADQKHSHLQKEHFI